MVVCYPCALSFRVMRRVMRARRRAACEAMTTFAAPEGAFFLKVLEGSLEYYTRGMRAFERDTTTLIIRGVLERGFTIDELDL